VKYNKSLFTEENGSTQTHSSESINTNKAKTAKTSTKPITVVDNWNYTVSQKKQDTKHLPITLPNIGRFSKFFHC